MDTHAPARQDAPEALDLAVTRHLPAPPARVFAAWTEPDRLKAWFGPRDMTVPVAEVDLRPGGRLHTVMRDAAGVDHPNPLAIEAVEPPRRLVLRVPEDSPCPLPGAVGTLDLAPEGEGTRLLVRWRHPSAEMRARHEEIGFAKGWGETLDKLAAHLLGPSPVPGAPAPAPEHGWLHRLIGAWTYETECVGPDGTAARAEGREVVRSLGGYWVIGEAEGSMPGTEGRARWVMTLGWDARAGRFRGSWAGSMMGHMFLYDGALSEDGRTLTLESEGPSFTGEGSARYRDILALEGEDRRVLHSEVQGADGGWTRFMSMRFRRAG